MINAQLLLALVVSNYVFKCGVEIIFTPVTYAVVARLKRSEGVDWYDTRTDFNPFRFGSATPDRSEQS
jgi:hypothetical protein